MYRWYRAINLNSLQFFFVSRLANYSRLCEGGFIDIYILKVPHRFMDVWGNFIFYLWHKHKFIPKKSLHLLSSAIVSRLLNSSEEWRATFDKLFVYFIYSSLKLSINIWFFIICNIDYDNQVLFKRLCFSFFSLKKVKKKYMK